LRKLYSRQRTGRSTTKKNSGEELIIPSKYDGSAFSKIDANEDPRDVEEDAMHDSGSFDSEAEEAFNRGYVFEENAPFIPRSIASRIFDGGSFFPGLAA